jgi:drug/metabolite transporter (DMT)-like permease
MHRVALVVVLSLAAALAFAGSSTLKHVSAGHAPDAQSLHPSRLARFARATLAHPLWLGGIGCDVVGLTLQVIALHLGALAVVQPLLICSLLFALLMRRLHDRDHVSGRQLGWACVVAALLAVFVTLATLGHPHQLHEHADKAPAIVAGIVGAVLAVACVELGRRLRGSGASAALLGVAVGVIYAATAALIKAATDIASVDPVRVLISWQLYAALVLGAGGLLLSQLAFQAGPITASLPATATVDPLLSIVVGVAVYDEQVGNGPGTAAVLAAVLLALGIAVIQLVRVPVARPSRGGRGGG